MTVFKSVNDSQFPSPFPQQEKQNEVERLNDRIAEAEGVNREKDNMISDMQRKLDMR